MSYTHNTYNKPASLMKQQLRDRAVLRTVEVDPEIVTAYLWKSNGSPVPADYIFWAGLPEGAVRSQEKARKAHVARVIEAQRNRTYSEEEKFEMRAAFGEGETVVNILTGEKIQL
jgi:hypothetical protein